MLTRAVYCANEPDVTAFIVETIDETAVPLLNGSKSVPVFVLVHCAQAPLVPAKTVIAATAAHRTAFAILT